MTQAERPGPPEPPLPGQEPSQPPPPRIQHGYALTIHASRAETVKNKGGDGHVSVLVNGGFSAPSTLVALRRHTKDVKLHVAMRRYNSKNEQGKPMYDWRSRKEAETRLEAELRRDGSFQNITSFMTPTDALGWSKGGAEIPCERHLGKEHERSRVTEEVFEASKPSPEGKKDLLEFDRPRFEEFSATSRSLPSSTERPFNDFGLPPKAVAEGNVVSLGRYREFVERKKEALVKAEIESIEARMKIEETPLISFRSLPNEYRSDESATHPKRKSLWEEVVEDVARDEVEDVKSVGIPTKDDDDFSFDI